jgi:hypothetical protein
MFTVAIGHTSDVETLLKAGADLGQQNKASEKMLARKTYGRLPTTYPSVVSPFC